MEPLMHLFLPLVVLLAFLKKYRKEAIYFSIFGVISDLDYFIPGYHRIIFHNVFFIAIVALAVYFIFGKLESLLSLYYLISHIILDFDAVGPALFWPFYNYLITFNISLTKTLFGPFSFGFKIITTPIQVLTTASASNWLSNLTIIFLLLTLSAIIASYTVKKK